MADPLWPGMAYPSAAPGSVFTCPRHHQVTGRAPHPLHSARSYLALILALLASSAAEPMSGQRDGADSAMASALRRRGPGRSRRVSPTGMLLRAATTACAVLAEHQLEVVRTGIEPRTPAMPNA